MVLGLLSMLPRVFAFSCLVLSMLALNTSAAVAGCTVNWRDDFSHGTLDRNRWKIVFSGVSSNGAFMWSSDDVTLESGLLTIRIEHRAKGWTTGGISEGGPGTHLGFYQVRARVEVGHGVGPAILLWPASNHWPGPEMNLMESPSGDRSTVWVTQHWRGSSGENQVVGTDLAVNASEWHTYAANWQRNSLDFLIDGTVVFHSNQHVSDEPAWMALQGYVADSTDAWYGGPPGAAAPQVIRIYVQWASVSAACAAGEEP